MTSLFRVTALSTCLILAGCARRRPMGRLELAPAETAVAPGACTPLRFTFRPEAALDRVHGRPTVFVHFRAENGRIVSGLDHALPGAWVPGVVQSYEIPLCPSALEPPLAPGKFKLAAGLYDDSWGYRWPLATGTQELDSREYLLAIVTVAAR